MSNQNKLWFRAKNYGWGWTPCSWQGWIVLFIWLIIFVFSVIQMRDDILMSWIVIVVTMVIFIWICYRKGERPRWRWGR